MSKDKTRWSKAEKIVSHSRSREIGSFTKDDLVMTNRVYEEMAKSELEEKLLQVANLAATSDEASIDALIETLKKARRKTSDEYNPGDDEEDDENLEDAGFHEVDPDAEGDDADKWLQENDKDPEEDEDDEASAGDSDPYEAEDEEPSYDDEEEAVQPDEEDEQADPDADVPAQVPVSPDQVQRPVSDVPPSGAQEPQAEAPQDEEISGGKFRQPSREEIAEMRGYTRPLEQKARDAVRLRAEAHKNPVLHREGNIVEARNTSHKDRDAAYREFTNSDEFKNADPVTQMEMESKFDKDFHEKNPDYLMNAIRSHSDAKEKGKGAEEAHRNAKLSQLGHIMQGGAQSGNDMSMEEAMQHAGGEKTDEGTTGSVVQDKAASFAGANKDFLAQLQARAKEHGSSAKFEDNMRKLKAAGGSTDENYAFDQKNKSLIRDILASGEMKNKGSEPEQAQSRDDIKHLLYDHPALKDPAKKKKVDEFFEHYHPLIGMNAKRVMNKLGLDPKANEEAANSLDEAGFHGLIQSINDYNHDNPSKANFATHASNKIRGLMQTHLRSQDAVPAELRRGAKEIIQASNHPKKNEMFDRQSRIEGQRGAQGVVKKPPTDGSGGQQ